MIFLLCLVLQFGLSLTLAFEFLLRSQMKEGNDSGSNSNGLPYIELLICPRLYCNCFILMNSFNNKKKEKRERWILLLPPFLFTVDEPEVLSGLVICLRSHSLEATETKFEHRQSSCRTYALTNALYLRQWSVWHGIKDKDGSIKEQLDEMSSGQKGSLTSPSPWLYSIS